MTMMMVVTLILLWTCPSLPPGWHLSSPGSRDQTEKCHLPGRTGQTCSADHLVSTLLDPWSETGVQIAVILIKVCYVQYLIKYFHLSRLVQKKIFIFLISNNINFQMSTHETDATFAGCPDPRCRHMNTGRECAIRDQLRVHSAPKPSHCGVIMRHTKSVIKNWNKDSIHVSHVARYLKHILLWF